MGNKIKLSIEDIGFITTFENVTKTNVKDCLIDKDKNKAVFIVAEGQAGMAIGKGGINIKRLENKLKKKIEVLEFSSDPLKFISNLIRPLKLKEGYISEKSDGTKVLHASILKNKFSSVRTKVLRAKELIKKYFDINDVIIQ